MPELSELITSKSVLDLKKSFDEGVAWLAEREVKRPQFYSDEMEVAEPLVRFVYTQLMMTAKRDGAAPHPGFPWRATRYVRDVLADNGAKFQVDNLARQVFSLLIGNGIGFKQHTGKSRFYLRVWPEGETLKWIPMSMRTTEDYRVEKRIEEENGKSPVKVYRNLRTIALPATIDAESIKDWVGRFVPAALDVEAERDNLRDEVEKLRAELEALHVAPEDWDQVGDALTAAFEDKKP